MKILLADRLAAPPPIVRRMGQELDIAEEVTAEVNRLTQRGSWPEEGQSFITEADEQILRNIGGSALGSLLESL